eukprot:362164-Amphidinium_carterae.1
MLSVEYWRCSPSVRGRWAPDQELPAAVETPPQVLDMYRVDKAFNVAETWFFAALLLGRFSAMRGL